MPLTPFEIQDEVERIRRVKQQQRGDISDFSYRRARHALYVTVLQEIAGGSVDPRSLAIAALEVENLK